MSLAGEGRIAIQRKTILAPVLLPDVALNGIRPKGQMKVEDLLTWSRIQKINL